MGHQRGNSRFPRTSGVRRRVSWGTGPSGTVTIAAASVNLFGSGAQFATDDLTLVRTRGVLSIAMDSAGSNGDGFDELAFGMAVVSENAAGIGVTAVPDPLADIAWDGWVVHWTGPVWGPTTALLEGGVSNFQVEINSKGMRKTHQSDVLVALLSAGTEVGVASITAKLMSRVLVKLP